MVVSVKGVQRYANEGKCQRRNPLIFGSFGLETGGGFAGAWAGVADAVKYHGLNTTALGDEQEIAYSLFGRRSGFR
jgi:hypothetical protein